MGLLDAQSRVGMSCETAQRAIALLAMAAAERAPFPAHPDEPAHPNHTLAGTTDRAHVRFAGPADDLAAASPSICTDSEGLSTESQAAASLQSVPVPVFAGMGAANGAGELPFTPKDNPALAEHLSGCHDCQAEMAATAAFFRALAADTGPEPSPTLLARARMRLDAELDGYARLSPWHRITQQFAFTAGRLRAAPALCSALLLAGLLGGGYGGYRLGLAAHAQEQSALLLAPPAPPEVPSVVADVSSVTRDPSTGLVEVRYDRLVPDALTGPENDPSMRELLMAAAENGVDPEVRDTSVSLLSGGCPGSACGGAGTVRNALLNALRTDKTPEVRREALAGLQPFIADDMEVRDAVLSALMSDPSASVRIEAVRMLQPVDVDSSVRQALHAVAVSDGDPTIRTASIAVLRSSPPVQ